MGVVYQKMKAAIYDLTEALDEAVAFKAAVPAMAGGPSIGRMNVHFSSGDYGQPSLAREEEKKYGDQSRFSLIRLS